MKVQVRTSEAARIRAGLEPLAGTVDVEIPVPDLTPAQREEVALMDSVPLGGRFGDPDVLDATPEAAIAILDSRAAARQQDRDKAAARREARIVDLLNLPLRDWIVNADAIPEHQPPCLRDPACADDPRIVARMEEAAVELPAIRALYAAHCEQRAAEKLARERDALTRVEALRTFARASGDPLLIARVAEADHDPAVHWKALARRVFADRALEQVPALADIIALGPVGHETCHTHPTPTLAALQLLATVREQIAARELPAHARIAIRPRDEDECVDDDPPTPVLVVSVEAPDGSVPATMYELPA